ncbi:MAG TPA: isoprenylcysteine carboxylmethyltransferase family protein [Longimicrobiales bacterium]|nr:isoprenylcysteine carboxylmethyltransferase family protein [Longimicrobiales bacterium]
MARVLAALYGIAAYALFLVTFLYAIGFVGNFAVPRSIDSGTTGALVPSILVNTALLLLFALQHSVMARPGFKRWWTRFVPEPIERSTFVLLSSGALLLLYALWRPMPASVWHVEAPAARALLWGIFAVGWATVFLSTVMIGHLDLFGLRQVWLHLKGRPRPGDHFRSPWLYRLIRHPIMTGFLLAFWATPDMTAGHLLFSLATTGYILVAVRLEERDLIAAFGEVYREYRRRVPAFVPLPGRRWSGGADAPATEKTGSGAGYGVSPARPEPR